MIVWGIADLHLSFARDDPRSQVAGRWSESADRIAREWRAVVGADDLVLIPGDVSMARNHREVQPDLAWLDRLPGTKVLSAGNHDGWFNGAAKVRPMLRRSQRAVGGDALDLGGAIVCGTVGAPVPDDDEPKAVSLLKRESDALGRALGSALALRGETERPVFVLWHYPPWSPRGRPGPVVEMLEKARVTACLYGHLHAIGQWGSTPQGEIGGVLYRCVAADAIGFRPLKVRQVD